MKFLVNTSKDFEYLEYTLDKVPALVNVKDRDDVPLFRNVIKRLFEASTNGNFDDVSYYQNIISLILEALNKDESLLSMISGLVSFLKAV